MELVIDELRDDDWAQVRRVYLEGLATGDASFEIDAPPWEAWDQRHHRHSRLAARRRGLLVGWAALTPVSTRACYAGVAEVSLYVSADDRGQGVGKRLLETLVASSERHGVWTLQGATFPENAPSLRIQHACGFRVIGRRERVAKRAGVWRDVFLTERRSSVVGVD